MLEIIDHQAVREIRLARPPANALNPELTAALTTALQEAGRDASAVMVTGLPRMFSAGLDVPELLRLDHAQMTAFWQDFFILLKTIAAMPVPTVFGLTGHAPAGGIVMALFADYRIMPEGTFKTGFNEVQVGLIVPPVVQRALSRLIGAHTAERILVAGEMMAAERALDLGLVDELAADPDAVVARALEWCNSHLALPARAMAITRSMARADLLAMFEEEEVAGVAHFVDGWFEKSTQAVLHGLVERLKGK
jgi:enoyl-CoA hydratase/carnithine racemase